MGYLKCNEYVYTNSSIDLYENKKYIIKNMDESNISNKIINDILENHI